MTILRPMAHKNPSSETSDRVPIWARKWLEKALAEHPASDAIQGDLLEDFHQRRRLVGSAKARAWFCRQALWLGVQFFFLRLFRPFVNATHLLERQRMREAFSVQGMISDARYAFRALRQDLGLFTFSTLITGLGVGATTAVFSVMNPLLLQPLPFEEPARLVWIANALEGGRSSVTSRTSNLRDLRAQSSSFEEIAGYNAFFEQESYTLTGQGEPERLAGVGVTDNFLPVLGVEPMLGRGFTVEEGERWDNSAVILAHDFWQRRFAGRRDIVNSTVTLNGAPSTIIGVLPPTFDFASIFSPTTRVDLLTIFPISDETDRWGNTISMIGRLAPDASFDNASAEVAVILERLRESQPERWGLDAELAPLQEVISGDHRSSLLLLFAAAASVLLIVCVNLSSLLLSKGIRRRKEMFLRAALGAPRGRLLRQMLFESLILSTCGAALGVGLAILITRSVASSSAVAIPMLASVKVDVWALLFSCLMALLAGLLVGLLPAIQASGAGSAGALRGVSRTLTASRRTRWVREGLVIAEVAIACALLIVGAWLMQSFSRVLEVDLGFQPTPLVAWLVDTDQRFESLEERSAFNESLIAQVRGVPGIEAVGLTDAIPLGINRSWTIGVPGHDFEPGESPEVFPHIVDRHYLETMGIPLQAGRHFKSSDTPDSELVAMINQSAADALFPNGAVGQAIDLGREIRIIGVVDDVRHLALEKGSGFELYLPMTQSYDYDTVDLVVRSDLPLDSIRSAVAGAIREVDPTMPTNDVRTLGSVVDRSVSPRRFTLSLLAGFAGTALLLAAMGIYSVLSYSVAERSREIAIRMALGESTGQIRGRVLSRTLGLASVGALIGIVLSLITSRFVAALLFGVDPSEATTLVTIPLILIAVAALAGFLPALKASRVDALATLQRTT